MIQATNGILSHISKEIEHLKYATEAVSGRLGQLVKLQMEQNELLKQFIESQRLSRPVSEHDAIVVRETPSEIQPDE